jgi:hypothetical protein
MLTQKTSHLMMLRLSMVPPTSIRMFSCGTKLTLLGWPCHSPGKPFKNSFLKAWGETDKEQTAKDKLKCMQQRCTYSTHTSLSLTIKISCHTSKFHELALHKLFYDGLKDGVKDLLLTLPDITSLLLGPRHGIALKNNWRARARQWDGRLQQWIRRESNYTK